MATAAELRARIAAAQGERAGEADKITQFDTEIDEANERQRLRRELERVHAETASLKSDNEHRQMRRWWIDRDLDGAHMRDGPIARPLVRYKEVLGNKEVLSCSEAVVKGEYLWKIEGLSWLVNTLQQNERAYAKSESFFVGEEEFKLVYHPQGGYLNDDVTGDNDEHREYQRGSLAIMHLDDEGITFRYKVLIKGRDGNFAQWGETGNECHPDADTYGWVFGPDVQVGEDPRNPIGIFGFSHEQLLESPWIDADALTVRVEIEMRPTREFSTSESNIEVPTATIGRDLLSLLEDGRCSDVTFVVEGECIEAHSQVLCARSEVFDRQLNGGLRETASKKIVIEDCDAATFKSFLRFLYNDDLNSIEEMVKAACAGSWAESAQASSCKAEQMSNIRLSVLQNVLAISHKYQVQRLRLWCERQLTEGITVSHVCSVLCQAHLYEAKQLEEACLRFIKRNADKVVVTDKFGSMAAEWSEVMLKLNIFMAGVPESNAASAIAAQQQARRSLIGKRKRDE